MWLKCRPIGNRIEEIGARHKTGKAGVIITGDQHLLNLKTYQKVNILTPVKFMANF
jgi:predicted nucleic acid-binding protein